MAGLLQSLTKIGIYQTCLYFPSSQKQLKFHSNKDTKQYIVRHRINISLTHCYSPRTHIGCHIPANNTAAPYQITAKCPRKHHPLKTGLVAPQNLSKALLLLVLNFFSNPPPQTSSSSTSSLKWMSSRRSDNTAAQVHRSIHWFRQMEAQPRRAGRVPRSRKEDGAQASVGRAWIL